MSHDLAARKLLGKHKVYIAVSSSEISSTLAINKALTDGEVYNTPEKAAQAFIDYQDEPASYVLEFNISRVFKSAYSFTAI